MQRIHKSSNNTHKINSAAVCLVVVVTGDSLEYHVAMRTAAEVPGVVQTDHLARTAGTGDARQVAGGPTLAALPPLVWEHFIIHLLRLHHTLGKQITVVRAAEG